MKTLNLTPCFLITYVVLGLLTTPAAKAASEPYRQIGEVPISERSFGFERASQAIGRLDLGTACTATRISPQGHLLTAFHCLPLCVYGQKFETIAHDFLGGGSARQFTPREGWGAVRCVSMSTASSSVPHYEWRKPMSLLAVGGRGYLSPQASANLPILDPALFAKLRSEGFTALGDYDDFAILKEEEVASDAAFLKLSCRDGFARDERVWSYGYPFYEQGSWTFYYDPAYSAGRVLDRIEDTAAMKDVESGKLSRDDALRAFFDRRLFWASLDAGGGASGGPVLDSQGEVSGLTIMKYTGNRRNGYDPGSHVAITIDHIRRELKRLLPEVDYRLVVDCPE